MATRYKVRFPDSASYEAALKEMNVKSSESLHTTKGGAKKAAAAHLLKNAPVNLRVQNSKRKIISVGVQPMLTAAEGARRLDSHLERLRKRFGAEIVPDVQYSSGFEDIDEPVHPKHLAAQKAALDARRASAAKLAAKSRAPAPALDAAAAEKTQQSPSLADILPIIGAEEAWAESKGEGVTVAVVDTGVSGKRPEFPQSKRVGQWQPIGDDAWTDTVGHGSMCACISVATRDAGGVYNGVAPAANLISCKTSFVDSELAAIYDYLTGLATEKKMNIVATNSFGWSGGTPPPDDPNSDFIPALNDAIAAGVKVVTAAGNDHQKVGGKPNSCAPNSIWLAYKSRADVLVVASCMTTLEMWFNSSRGPGQYFGKPDTGSKPDVTAPTLANGYVVYGDDVQQVLMWGTSGAGPQVAGLAALLLSKKPDLSRDDLFNAIRKGAGPLSKKYNQTCMGSGMINCKKALASI
ncbi:MAG: S8 family serine peptidase [Acidobacteriota bacterium]|nr:S8 family serine peptidase [Acidobacteriota bacterium]